MPTLEQLFALPLFGNSWLEWSLAAGLMLLTFGALLAIRRGARGYFRKLVATQDEELLELPMEVLSRTTVIFVVVVALVVGAQALTMSPKTAAALSSAFTITFFWQSGLWLSTAASAWLARKRRLSLAVNRAAVGSFGIIGFVISVAVWSMVVLLTLDNLGVDITALVAGLGIGGIAVALALQNVLGDLFAALSITLDQPFVVGDFLMVDEFLGTVEYIGIKSTRLRSLSGEQIVIANGDLLGSRVRNYGRMQERRVVFATSVTYETPIDLVERIPVLIRKIVEEQEGTRFDRCHFAKHAAASLDFETVYYVNTADYNRYMDVQQAINLRLHRELAALGVEFAYPTQKLYVVAPAQPEQPSGRYADERRRSVA